MTPHSTHICPKPGAIRDIQVSASSVQTTPPQVICDDDISDSIEDKLDVVGVRGAGHMGVDLFVG